MNVRDIINKHNRPRKPVVSTDERIIATALANTLIGEASIAMDTPETEVTSVDVSVFLIGRDSLDIEVVGMSDIEVLTAARLLHPHGFNVMGGNIGPVWLHPAMLLGLAQPDGFGLELMGLANTAADLLRLCADPSKAEQIGSKGQERLLMRFCAQAENRAMAKRVNQLHAYRFGMSAKIVASDRVHPHTMEVHPTGRANKMLAKTLGCKPSETKGKWTLALRHPFIYGGVFQVEHNTKLSNNLVMGNRNDVRRITKGDADGDTLNFFPISGEEQALQLWEELDIAVPGTDPTLLIRGISATSPEAEMWGEVVSKTVQDKLTQKFTKSADAWVQAHVKMGKCANTFTGYAYRISDICSLMAAVGHPGAREAGLMGAVIEEDFYLGLAGGPDGMDEALEAWMSKKMSKATQIEMFNGLAKGLDRALLTQDVKNALVKGALINKRKMDEFMCTEAIPYFAWLVGKGFTTSGEPRDEMPIVDRLNALLAIAKDGDVPEHIRDNFITKMVTHAARKLSQVVGETPEFPMTEEGWGHEPETESDYLED